MLLTPAFKKYTLIAGCVLCMTVNIHAQKLVDSIVTYDYPTERDSVNRFKIASEYNGPGQLASYSIYYWSGRWEGWSFPCEECLSPPPGRYEYSYDERGDQVFTMTFTWWGSQTGWVERSRFRTENGYDDRGNSVSTFYLGWNFTINEWYPYFGYEYGYDEAGNLVFKSTYDRDPTLTRWHGLENMIYSFDGLGRKILEVRQIGSETDRDWVNQLKTEWVYDSTGITTEYATYRWTVTGINSYWREEERRRIIKEFDQAGNLVLTMESIKVSKTRWIPTMKEERAYNPAGQPVLTVISRGLGALTEDFRSEWVYNPDGRLIQETLTGAQVRWPGGMAIKRRAMTIRSLDGEGNTSRVIWYYWDGVTKSYLFNSKDYHFYHPVSTGNPVTVIESLRIYPNPSDGMVNLAGLTQPAVVKIYTMQGVLLRSVQDAGLTIDLTDLPSGAYLIQVDEAGRPPFRTVLIRE